MKACGAAVSLFYVPSEGKHGIMLPRAQRLDSVSFEHAFKHSRTYRDDCLSVRVHKRNDGRDTVRAAFVVPRKQGKAAWRNRVRRRLRAAYRAACKYLQRKGHSSSGEMDLIFFANSQIDRVDFAALVQAMQQMLERIQGSVRDKARRDVVPASTLLAEQGKAARFLSDEG